MIAGTVIVALPIFLVLLVFQRQLVRGLTAGAGEGMRVRRHTRSRHSGRHRLRGARRRFGREYPRRATTRG
ncbi:MAG: hypothetical protein R2713_18715 [Ilumatobacteraceae bacterium]